MSAPQNKKMPVTLSILESALGLTFDHSTIGALIKGKWITPQTFLRAIQARGVLHSELELNVGSLNKLLPKIPKFCTLDRYDGSNQSGLFKLIYSKKLFYHIVEPGVQVKYPVLDSKTFKIFVKTVDREVQSISFRSNRENEIPLAAAAAAAAPANSRERRTREEQSSSPVPPVQSKRQKVLAESYWDSDEARKLFEPREGDSSCRETLERRVHQLRAVQQGCDGWRHAVVGRDPDNICTETDKVIIRQKALLLCLAYQIALDSMNKKTWLDCCKAACLTLNPLGISQTKRGDNVQLYNRLFRRHEAFPHPNIDVRAGRIQALPPMLRAYQSIREGMQRYCVANMTTIRKHIMLMATRELMLWRQELHFVRDIFLNTSQDASDGSTCPRKNAIRFQDSTTS
jgi:hypothetical protein